NDPSMPRRRSVSGYRGSGLARRASTVRSTIDSEYTPSIGPRQFIASIRVTAMLWPGLDRESGRDSQSAPIGSSTGAAVARSIDWSTARRRASSSAANASRGRTDRDDREPLTDGFAADVGRGAAEGAAIRTNVTRSTVVERVSWATGPGSPADSAMRSTAPPCTAVLTAVPPPNHDRAGLEPINC